ncbi:MAG: DUF2157 domain-containing protein [Mangrovibacterium sp.]
MPIQKDIQELVNAEVISREIADKISDYYRNKGDLSVKRLYLVFGILGAILIGLGIILIIAHNWDDLSVTTKTGIAFLPLVTGQIICGFTLIKKPESVSWRESSSAFLFFAVGASISMISQIYNIPGNLSSFLLTWMLLCLPLIYLMRSSIVSLLYIIGITYYACETGYWSGPSSGSYTYWILLFLCLPHYYQLLKKRPESNFMIFHNWLIPVSVVITLGTLSKSNKEFMYIAYFNLFGFLYLLGNMKFFLKQKLSNNGYLVTGTLGTIILLLTLSFDWFWKDLGKKSFYFNEVATSPEFIASAILFLLAGALFYREQTSKALRDINPFAIVFLLFIVTFFIGLGSGISVLLINIIAFAIGVWTIRDGAKRNHLGILNFGLLIIAALVICRFFDEDISFAFRGILFVSVGIGFFAANYIMLKRRKTNE